jgi:hypothetical protein
MNNLTPREKATLEALAACIIPEGGPVPFGFKEINYLPFIEEMAAAVPAHIRWVIHFNLWFIEYFGCLYLHRLKAFSKLGLNDRELILLSLRGSKRFLIRGIYILTSALFLIPMYKDESVMNAIGYTGFKNGVNKIT